MTSAKRAELPVRLFKDGAGWEAWLAKQHANSAGLWLRIAKAASNVTSVSYAEALDVALCYGWIDGQKKAFDDATWLQTFTPRGERSIWSKINREKVQRLIESGRMQSSGPDPGGEASRDAHEEDRAVRRHARAARGDPLVALARGQRTHGGTSSRVSYVSPQSPPPLRTSSPIHTCPGILLWRSNGPHANVLPLQLTVQFRTVAPTSSPRKCLVQPTSPARTTTIKWSTANGPARRTPMCPSTSG